MSDLPSDPLPPWRHWTIAERERAYSPSSVIGGDYGPFIQAYADRSAQARIDAARLGGRWQRLAYGPSPCQGIELCRPPPGPAAAALLVFIHGGYWQELDAERSLFAAAACIGRGMAFAAIDYTLAPQARVGDIVAECRQALGLLFAQAASLGIDARRVVVAGSSAGGHLAAMCALREATAAYPPGCRPAAAVLVSGVFWLEPLVGTGINDALGMDAAEARAASPGPRPLAGAAPALVCWGEHETAAFKDQSRAYAAALQDAGVAVRTLEVAGRNHFDIILDLAEPGTLLCTGLSATLTRDP
ncbi:MAG: alpha/beta hydrolase [Aquabacterium sp.]